MYLQEMLEPWIYSRRFPEDMAGSSDGPNKLNGYAS